VLIIPAIDIKDGKCVRLFQGDFKKSKVYYKSPVEVARLFEDRGAKLIHIVDLDGAKKGEPVNLPVVEKIIKDVRVGIELGGGIRTVNTIKKLCNLGIKRIILGTKVVENIKFLSKIKKYIKNLIIGIDLKNEYLSTHGWVTKTEYHYRDFIKKLRNNGIKELIITDIARDGVLKGPNFGLYEKISDEFPEMEIIVSGGISKMDDIARIIKMKRDNIKGIIIGKAIYENKINLQEALNYVS